MKKKIINTPLPYFDDYKEAPNGLPTVFYIETVMACNLGCPECVIGTDNVSRSKKIMKMEEFELISKKIEPYAKIVYLHKWGEPLMNKNIVKMISLSSKYAHTHISTNGILINDKKAEDLITSGLGTLIISIDGITQKVYEKYRVGGKVKDVIDNIKKLKEINEYYSNPVKILPQFIVFDHNYDEVNEFKTFCKNLDLTPVFKKPYIRFGSVKESNDKNFQRKKYMSQKEHLNAISMCPNATCVMTITANGKLLLCAQDYNGEWPIGNILDNNSTVENLWNDSFYREIRKERIINKCPPEICIKKCMIYNPGYDV